MFAQLVTAVPTVSSSAAVVKTSPVFMEAPALIMDLTSNASAQLAQLAKLVNRTPVMNVHTILVKMAVA